MNPENPENFQPVGFAGDIDLRNLNPEGLFVDLDATAAALQSNLDRLLGVVSDRALSEALDAVEEYHQITEGEMNLRLSAGLTVLYVARVRAERDRRLAATGRRDG